jgi:cytochrome c551/c552
METRHAFNGGAFSFEGDGGEAAPAGEEVAAAAGAPAAPAGALETFGCTRCHSTDRAGELDGPSLFDVGARLGRYELLSALVYHEGDDGLDQVTQADLRSLVAVMSDLKGQG